jgi:hypothetical protein
VSRRVAALLIASLIAAIAGCGSDDVSPAPRVDLIDDAVAAAEQAYGAPQQYFEISATLDRVIVTVAVDEATAAEQGGITADGGVITFEPVGPATGETFTADAIAFDPDRIFDGLRDELGDPTIVDFAIQGTDSGGVIYDATVASSAGGVLLVLLGPAGQVLGVQGQ